MSVKYRSTFRVQLQKAIVRAGSSDAHQKKSQLPFLFLCISIFCLLLRSTTTSFFLKSRKKQRRILILHGFKFLISVTICWFVEKREQKCPGRTFEPMIRIKFLLSMINAMLKFIRNRYIRQKI